MQITIDTANLSELDIQVLAVLTGGATAAAPTPAPAAEKAAPAAKKAAAPKAEAKAAKTPEPEEAEDETDEPNVDEDTNADGPTKADAIELATKLVSNGDAKKVKSALAEVGAKRVSELTDDNVATFVGLLND